MKKLRSVCICLLGSILLPLCAWPQSDTLELEEIEIIAQKIRQEHTGSQVSVWKRADLQKNSASNLGDLLQEQTNVYIKSYGMGSLATSSIRGASAGHSLILWNGLPLQSPMLGQLDLSLIPIQGAESIQFQKGGNSALWGSGAIGGTISLNNEANFSQRQEFKFHTEFGDFGRFHQRFKVALGNQKIKSVSKFFFREAENDFLYTPAPGLERKRQTHAQLIQKNFLQDVYWNANSRNLISLHVWRQDSRRELPPTLVQQKSLARQEDDATRFMLNWQHRRGQALLKGKAGIFEENLNYFDELIGFDSFSRFQKIQSELGLSWRENQPLQFYVGGAYRYTRAWSGGYENIPSEHNSSLFASATWDSKRWRIQGSLRQSLVDDQFIPLVPTLGLQFRLAPQLMFKSKVSRNYRLPTFNDRYWLPGGNPQLMPESGWSEEATIEGTWGKKRWNGKISLTAYNRIIDNWILWSIREGESYWSANNITKVWSRGIEPRVHIRYRQKATELMFSMGYDYSRSTNQVALELPRMPAGTQLLYTPVHQAFARFRFSHHAVSLSYTHRYKGGVSGINKDVSAFQVADVGLQYQLSESSALGSFFIRINNVWNTNYLVIERRPMPGINYQFGFTLHLYNKQNL